MAWRNPSCGGWNFEDKLRQGRRQLLRSGGLSLYRAAGSNLRMVRPSSMSVVKLLIICAREARGKIFDLASYLVVRRRSHCTSASNWELPLLCYPTLQGTSSLIKSWENTYDFSYCNQCCERENLQCVAQVEDLLRTTAQQVRLNWCTILHVHKNRTDNLPMCSVSQWVCCT